MITMKFQKVTGLFFFIIALLATVACTQRTKEYRIGVSQCAGGQWRDKVNQEMLAAQHLYNHDAKVIITCAHDDTERQIEQIDSLTSTGIDLLVVAPTESAPLADIIAKVRAKGIPVIYFDRKAETQDYTAFIGGNNTKVGQTIGNYTMELAQKQSEGRKTRILEITGAMSSSPAQERHDGFRKAIQDNARLDYTFEDGKWSSDKAYKIVKAMIGTPQQPDIIFCHNDGMATGVYKAMLEGNVEEQIQVIGVDGLPNEGIEYVQLGHQTASYVYPTHGEQIVKLALDILTGKPYQRNNELQGMMVTPNNAELVMLNSKELTRQNQDLVTVQDKLEDSIGLYNTQHKLLLASLLSILLLTVAILLAWRAIKQTRKVSRRMRRLNEEQTLFYTNASHQLRTPLTLIAGPVRELNDSQQLNERQQELIGIVDRNVTLLERLVSNVLNFRREVDNTCVSDDNSDSIGKDVLRETRLSMFKQEDTDELSTILVIDDNADMRTYLRTLLANRFYVIEAADGQTGLKLARESVPDIVVSDVMMPVMDGLQLCKNLKNDTITSHIPVILLTARSAESQQIEGYEHGADAYITKPFHADLLIARIHSLLRNRQLLAEMFGNKKKEEQEGNDQQPVTHATTKDLLFANALKEAINAKMSNPNLKMDELGEELGLGRVQLYRKTKALTGVSPVELLRQMRLQQARTLLTTTTKTIAEIAYEVGFATPGYFSKCFRAQYGKLPMELRS